MSKPSSNKSFTKKILDFLNDHPVVKHLIYAGLFLFGILLMTLLWLRIYTNHGQKIETPAFEGLTIEAARELARKNNFRINVTDSIFLVGQKGGRVYKQNPQPGFKVKENRMIYLTLTKHTPDQIYVRDLPKLYGNDFSQKKTELEYRGIKSSIKGRKYDPGEPNHILEVYYKDQLIINAATYKEDVSIDKGGTLEFVLSDKGGGEITIPSVVCMTLAEAEFLLDQSKLGLADVVTKGTVTDRMAAFVIAQNPPYDGVTKIEMGQKISVTISNEKPATCN